MTHLPKSQGSLRPPAQIPDSKASSPIAAQLPAQGLLQEIVSRHRPLLNGIPILEDIESLFINRSVKAEFISQLKEKFIKGTPGKETYIKNDAARKFDTYIAPILSNCDVEYLECYEFLVNKPGRIEFLRAHLDKSLAGALATLPRVSKLIGRLRLEDQHTYLQAWIDSYTKETNKQIFAQFVDRFKAHLAYAEKVQSRRPTVFDQESEERWALYNESMEMLGTWTNLYRPIQHFDIALRDSTVIDNRQILQYSIMNIYRGIIEADSRTIPDLSKRNAAPFGLLNQLDASVRLPEGVDYQTIYNFRPTVEAYLTDPFSMETRSVRIPLPIEETITIGEAKKKLNLLQDFVGMPQRFDAVYEKSGLPPLQKEIIRDKFQRFDRQLANAFGRALGDFNSTPKHARETYAREQPPNAQVIEYPYSKKYAIEAAKLRNLFLLEDGTLSLIPSGPGEKHRVIGTLSREEVIQATQALEEKIDHTSLDVPDLDQKIKKATLTVKPSRQQVLPNVPYIVVDTTLTLDGKTTNRTNYYECLLNEKTGKRESQEEVIQRITASRLFERDLLILKSKFIEQHVKTI